MPSDRSESGRFLLFAGDCYYPQGGWDDFHSQHDTTDAAVAAISDDRRTFDYDWFHIVDRELAKVTLRGERLRRDAPFTVDPAGIGG